MKRTLCFREGYSSIKYLNTNNDEITVVETPKTNLPTHDDYWYDICYANHYMSHFPVIYNTNIFKDKPYENSVSHDNEDDIYYDEDDTFYNYNDNELEIEIELDADICYSDPSDNDTEEDEWTPV